MKTALKQFLSSDAAGGIVLIGAAALSMIMANFFNYTAGPDARPWVEYLMAVFFFQVGLEIKSEIRNGTLSLLPVVAAAGGMAVPALVYILFNRADMHGWAIPSATDIAFALGVLSLVPGVPPAIRILLLAIAVLDDLGAVIIIGLFYTSGAAVGGMVALSGVVAALFVPTAREKPLMKALHGWVAFLVMPLFALANAGVNLKGVSLHNLTEPVPLGIAAGLFLGKQAGIFTAIAAAVKTRAAPMPNATWRDLYGMSLLCGVGFTMSLFIGGLAFDDMHGVRIGVLTGSLLSAVAGYVILRRKRP